MHLSTSSTTIKVWIQTNGLISKVKAQIAEKYYFWNVQVETNILICHLCKVDVVEIWPHLTFGWPFVNISLTIHPTHSKLYIFVILITSRVMWYTWKVIWSILKFWPPLDLCVTPTGKGPNSLKFCQNIFWPTTTSKPSITHFRQNGTWVLLPLQSSIHFLTQLAVLVKIQRLLVA